MKRGRAWGSLPSPANYPQGKIHVAILSINPLNNAVVRRYFIASDLVRQAVGIEAERMGENERVSNGAFQLQCWSRWRGIFLTMMVLPLGGPTLQKNVPSWKSEGTHQASHGVVPVLVLR